jgi:Mg-chelatase subunit ChlI
VKDRPVFPFTAIVGQPNMKMALVLNAINPRLGGVLIRGEKGTAKSTAVRALASLLPEMPTVRGCRFRCDPGQAEKLCLQCREKLSADGGLETVGEKMPVVDLPINATEDRVVGTLDLEHALRKGEKRFEPGILAQANRGILYVDEVNLLDDHIVDVLLDAAAMGVNFVEREGVSYSHPAEFILVGTMNPEEGELRPQLLDRFGLCVNIESIADPEQRVEIVKRWSFFEGEPLKMMASYADAERELADQILKARALLPSVRIADPLLQRIAEIGIALQVDGHRSDLVMMKAAKTVASFRGRQQVGDDDVEAVIELALTHRMRRRPFEERAIDRSLIDDRAPRADGGKGR